MKKLTLLLLASILIISCSSDSQEIKTIETDDDEVVVEDDDSGDDDGDSEVDDNSGDDDSAEKPQIKVSEESGTTNYNKLISALTKANIDNEILIDVDIDFAETDKAIILDKPNITIKGADITGDKYKLTRIGIHKSRNNILNSLIVVTSDNIKIENVELLINDGKGYRCAFIGSINANGGINSRTKLYSNISFSKCDFKQTLKTGITRGLFFEGSFANVVVEECCFNNWFGLVARDCPTLDNFTINKNTFLDGSHQISLDGALLGETDPTYGIGEVLVKHADISVTNNTFGITKSFNLAIANTQNVYVFNNDFEGGIQAYSQPVHIEDHSKNIEVIGNRINNPNSTAILVYSTDKVGHGQGRAFTNEEKKAKGSGNVLIKDNITSSKNPCVIATYLQGYLKFEGQNTFSSTTKPAVRVGASNADAEVFFNDNNSTFNGLKRDSALSNGEITIDATIIKL